MNKIIIALLTITSLFTPNLYMSPKSDAFGTFYQSLNHQFQTIYHFNLANKNELYNIAELKPEANVKEIMQKYFELFEQLKQANQHSRLKYPENKDYQSALQEETDRTLFKLRAIFSELLLPFIHTIKKENTDQYTQYTGLDSQYSLGTISNYRSFFSIAINRSAAADEKESLIKLSWTIFTVLAKNIEAPLESNLQKLFDINLTKPETYYALLNINKNSTKQEINNFFTTQVNNLLSKLSADDPRKNILEDRAASIQEYLVKNAPAQAPSSPTTSQTAQSPEQDIVTRINSIDPKNLAGAAELLGLNPGNYSESDITKAFRKLSPKVHPDQNKAPGAADAFNKLTEIKDALIKSLQIPAATKPLGPQLNAILQDPLTDTMGRYKLFNIPHDATRKMIDDKEDELLQILDRELTKADPRYAALQQKIRYFAGWFTTVVIYKAPVNFSDTNKYRDYFDMRSSDITEVQKNKTELEQITSPFLGGNSPDYTAVMQKINSIATVLTLNIKNPLSSTMQKVFNIDLNQPESYYKELGISQTANKQDIYQQMARLQQQELATFPVNDPRYQLMNSKMDHLYQYMTQHAPQA